MCRLQILVKRIREQACAVNECNYDDFSLWFEHLIEHSVGPMHNELAETGIVLFRNYSAAIRKLAQ